MTESLEKLRRMVTELEAELAQVSPESQEARDLLSRLAADVEMALQDRSTDALSSESFMDRLKESAQDFESSHPTAASLFNQIVDTLGHMGI
jgi:hypothetical protein